jgi:hypothetical protein
MYDLIKCLWGENVVFFVKAHLHGRRLLHQNARGSKGLLALSDTAIEILV